MRSKRNGLPVVLLVVMGLALFAVEIAASGKRQTVHASAAAVAAAQQDSRYDTNLGKGYRFERGGWTYVHLEGTPHDIGVQHGYLLAPEIADVYGVLRLEMTHNTGRDSDFFSRAARG